MPGCVDRTNAEDDIVFGERNGDVGGVPSGDDVGPVGLAGVTVDNLEGGAGGEAQWLFPAEGGPRVIGRIEHRDVAWLPRRGGQRGQRRGVEAGYVGDVVEVDKLQKIAILDAVFRAQVLVL